MQSDRIDKLQRTLCSQIELKTGFGDAHQKSKMLTSLFSKFDNSGKGKLDRNDFYNAMQKLNISSDPKDIDQLFNVLDKDSSGSISIREISDATFGINKRIPLASTECRCVVQALRAKVLQRSGGTFRELAKTFRRMDKNKNGELEPKELMEAFSLNGATMTNEEIAVIMKYFDGNKSGTISQTEFLRGLRGPMGDRRLKLVKIAYKVLDKASDGRVTLEELATMYNADQHPSVKQGIKTAQQVMKEFIEVWDKNRDESVTLDEVVDYYEDLSCNIDNDDYFELMIRNAWHMSGGQGAAENTSCRRVLVVHTDGRQQVYEIKNDMGIRPTDMEKMRAALQRQGVKDIQKIFLHHAQ